MNVLNRCILAALALSLSVGCGPPESVEDRTLEALSVSEQALGAPTHSVCGDGINVRNAQLAVIGLAARGESVTLMPERITGTGSLAGNVFARVYFHAAPVGYGFIGQQFVCKLGTQPPVATVKRLIDVNYTTNRLKFFVDGKLVREWNVGTMREDVRKAGDYKIGRFPIWAKDICPSWRKPGSATEVPSCVASNPLGTRGLWFSTYLYGLHGTIEPWKIAEGTTAAERKVSSGCIRNSNANIEWLYDQVKIGDEVNLHW
jgi:lipoprotein-anchoring transpeptidase ErfK/SrfK